MNTLTIVVDLIIKYMMAHRAVSLISVLALISVPFQEIIIPHFTGKVVNRFHEGCDAKSAIYALVIIVGFTQFVIWTSEWVEAIMWPTFQSFVRSYMLENLIMNHMNDKKGKDYDAGDIISKVVKVPIYTLDVFDTVKSSIPHILVFVCSVLYVSYYDWMLGLILFICTTILIVNIFRNIRGCKQTSLIRDQSQNVINEQVDDVMQNMYSVIGGNKVNDELKNLKALENTYQKKYYKNHMCTTNVKLYMIPIAIALYLAVLLRCNVLIKCDSIKIGTFVAIMGICLHTLISSLRILHWSKGLIFSWGPIMSAHHLLERSKSIHKKNTVAPCKDASICIKNLYYDIDQKKILTNINLSINKGERIAFVGSIGSGKTTLLNLIAGFFHPTSGTVSVNESTKLYYIPQRPVLFNRTVFDNIRYNVEEYDISKEKVWSLIDSVGLTPLFDRMPNKLDTIAGKNGSSLSGGQRQAVWILRMMLSVYVHKNNDNILLMDEPTASMDDESKTIVSQAILKFPADTVIFVSHDTDVVSKIATKIVKLHHGFILSERLVPHR